MSRAKATEVIMMANRTAILHVAGHIVHQSGTRNFWVEIFREDRGWWVLADVRLKFKTEFYIAPPHTRNVYCFKPNAEGIYEYIDENDTPVPLGSISAERIKELVTEYEEFSGAFSGTSTFSGRS